MRVGLILLVLLTLAVGCQGEEEPMTAPPFPVMAVITTPVTPPAATALGAASPAPLGGAAPAMAPTAAPRRVTPTPYATANLPAVQSPAWARDAVMYQIFVRSFADSDGDGIGDLNGITSRLDYLKDLGVTALWLTPIFQAASYHGYDTTDYYAIQPEYGTQDDLARLVDEAHARGMKVILDYVAGHTSNEHPFFKDAYNNPQSQYAGFYRWTNESHTTYDGFAGLREMPALNYANPETTQTMLDAAEYWLTLGGTRPPGQGIDGFRLDYVLGVPHSFWKELRQTVKDVNPDALLLGEAWTSNRREIVPYFDNEFDAAFDFPLYGSLQGNHDRVGDGVLPGQASAGLLELDAPGPLRAYPPGAISVAFINNHDTNRAMSDFGGNMERAKTAAAFLLTIPQTPIVYYGEEIGMQGTKGAGSIGDMPRREPMDWYAAESGPDMTTWWKATERNNRAGDGVSVEEQQGKPDSLLETYRALMRLRRDSPALRQGSYEPLKAADNDKAYAHVRRAGDDIVLAVFNFGDAPASLTFDLSTTGLVADAYAATDALTGAPAPDIQPPMYQVDLPAGGSKVLRLKPR